MSLEAQIVEAWQISNRLNLFFLAALKPEALEIAPTKGKTVGGQFAHIHNVRLMWLKPAAPDLLGELQKIEPGASVEELSSGLTASGEAIAKLLNRGLQEGKIKGFKPHSAGFFGYLIAHEADHRGQAELILRQIGHPLDDKTAYGLWEWGVR